MLTRIDEFVGMLDMVISFMLVITNYLTFVWFMSLSMSHISCFSPPPRQIRNDTSQIVNENLPQIQQKSDEMRQIYRRIDKLDVSGSLPGTEVFLRTF